MQAFGSAADAMRLRSEDAPLLTGRGQFTDDLNAASQAHAAFVRTTVAHAVIRKIDTASAMKMPGVIAVITGRDLAADNIGDIPPVASFNGRDGKPMFQATMPVLAAERVRYVGESVAFVSPRRRIRRATRPKRSRSSSIRSPRRRTWSARWRRMRQRSGRNAPGNIALDWEDGDAAAVDAAFARAAHVERVRLIDTRLAPSAMEPRAAIASYDAQSGRYTLIAPTQGVAVVRKVLAEGVFKVPGEPDPHPDARRGRRLRHEGADLFRIRRLAVCGTPRRAAGASGAPAGWRAFSPIPMGATGCWRPNSRSTPPENSSACGRAPMSASAPTRRHSPRSFRPPTPRTASPASTSFRRSTSA